MANSLQNQLLKLGLVDKKRVAETRSKKYKQQKMAAKGRGAPTAAEENARLQREAEEKKKARVKRLNREREQKLQQRAAQAAIKQLIEQNAVERSDGGDPFRFNMGGKIHRLFVDREMVDRLSTGALGIVRVPGAGERFEVLPRAVLEKIQQLDSPPFIHLAEAEKKESDADDPYAEYKVPDDLMW